MREEDYQVSFEIIATAGDSKGYSMDAICDARKGKFDSANEKINEANKKLLKAHELQTDMIAQEAGGDPVPVNIILSTLKLEIKRVVDIAALTFPIPLSTNMTSFEHSFPS